MFFGRRARPERKTRRKEEEEKVENENRTQDKANKSRAERK